MLNNSIFYHSLTRKIIVGFGSLFSDIKVRRENRNGPEAQTIHVPIAWGPKEKWIVKIEQDPTQNEYTYTSLPRMAFEITNFSFDSQRKMNRSNFITCSTGEGTMKRTFAPVPYNIDISLYALTKTTEDGLQIVEQILPFFSPELTMSINAVEESNIVTDIPIILNSLDVSDEYDGDFETRRFVTHTLNFTLKAWMFGPVSDGKIINRVFVNTDYANLDMLGNVSTGIETHVWNEDYS